MGLVLSVLLAVLLSLLGGLYHLGVFRRRRPGEPPLDRGPVPWLGHVLEFRRDTAKFLERMKRKHGDIFTVQLGGFYYTFITDPLSYGSIFKEARVKLDFHKFARAVVTRAFGYRPMDIEHKFVQLASIKHLMGDGLVIMTQAMMGNLQNLMLHSVHSSGDEQRSWIEGDLFMYCYNIVFRAGYLSLFGNEPETTGSIEKAKEIDRQESEEMFREFRKFDLLFPKLVFGILPPKGKMEVERLRRVFFNTLSQKFKTNDNISGWVSDQQRLREEHGMEAFMRDRFMLLLLWASQSNTGPSAFWLLLYLMKHPEAMKAVQGEVQDVLRATGQEVKRGGPLINLTRDMLLKTPILDSAVEENLRLTTASLLNRAVVEDLSIKMASGQEYLIRAGDRVSLFPYTAVQMDPEVHSDPQSFKHDRFLNPDGSKKTDFYKAGKKVKYYNMPWGAGNSMCPGRFFATNELKQFVFLMLTYFDFELKNPDEQIPKIDTKRWGFGTMQPTRDVQFRYRLRF